MGLIAISGKKGAGKNTVASLIQYLIWKNRVEKRELTLVNYTIRDFRSNGFVGGNLSEWEQKSFAGKLKKMVSMLTNIRVDDLEDQDIKDRVLGKEWTKVDILPDNPDEEWTPTVRWLLQTLGTDVMRDRIHPDIWVNALFVDYVDLYKGVWSSGHQLYEKPNWIITDMRFPNELKAVKNRGGITIRVNKTKVYHDDTEMAHAMAFMSIEGKLTEEHPSETALDGAEFDFVINNDGSIDDLLLSIKKILKKLKML